MNTIPPLLEEAFVWEKVVRWTYEHPVSLWAKRVSWYPSAGEYLGKSVSPLLSPLACYLNEYTLSVLGNAWLLDRTSYRSWYERGEPYHITAWHSSNPEQNYPVPLWVEQAEYLTDMIQGEPRPSRSRRRHPHFEPAWITQAQFLTILEQVLHNEIPLRPPIIEEVLTSFSKRRSGVSHVVQGKQMDRDSKQAKGD